MVPPQFIDDLGPLPQSDRNAELQRLSFIAFKSFLPPDRFVIRDERIEDAGIDASLELLINSRYTNFRSQIQLKGTDKAITNTDGALSVQIAPANLNYLLNGPSPLYILYVAPRNELRFLWARDERKRLDNINPDWLTQEKVSIRFEKILTPNALEQIRERIFREGRLQRQIYDLLGGATISENVVITVNADTLAITDPGELNRILLNGGLAIVASGYANEVKSWISLLKPCDAESPRIQLVKAYAECTLGRYQAAIACISEAEVNQMSLSPEDRRFSTFLRSMCEYQIGSIDFEEYQKRIAIGAVIQSDSFALAQLLNNARYLVLQEENLDARREKVENLRALTASILASEEAGEVFKIHARLMLLEAEAQTFLLTAGHENHYLRLRASAGFLFGVQQALQSRRQQAIDWERRWNLVLQDAIRLNHPLMIGDALIIGSLFTVYEFASIYTLNLMLGRSFTIPQNRIEVAVGNVKQAAAIFSKAKQLEGELRAKITLAELLVILDKRTEAKSIAVEVLPKAEAMNYAHIIWRAQSCLSETTLIDNARNTLTQASTEDKDIPRASDTDELLEQTASEQVKALSLPPERQPVILRDLFRHRQVAVERLRWCRHIEMHQDLEHEQRLSTYYKNDPERLGVCLKHNYKSILRDPDWIAVLSAFKQTYCSNCPDREPKQKSQEFKLISRHT